MYRILIADDDRRLREFLEKGFRAAGMTPTIVGDGMAATSALRGGDFELLVLDLGLPGKNGLEVLRELRGEGHSLPVIVLTGMTELADVAVSLEAGADDYVPKPFRFDELLARVRARLRTQTGSRSFELVLVNGDLSLDLRTHRAHVGGRTIALTPREFALLETFMRHPDQILSQEQILSHVWGYSFDPGSNVVEVYVRLLREKLGSEAIETVRGVGYRLRPASSLKTS